MFPFRSKIRWIDLRGNSTVLEPSEFEKRCVQAASLLQRIEEKKICLLWEPGIDAFTAFIGCILAGKIPCYYTIPNFKLDSGYFEKQIAGLRAQELCLLSSARFQHLGIPILPIAEPFEGELINKSSVLPEQPLFMQFSSGTTGIRKRISYTAAELICHNLDYAKALQLGDSERIISWLPHYHDMGLIAAFLLPLHLGYDITAMSNLEWLARPDLFVSACREFQPTLCWQPNFAFDYLVSRCEEEDLSATRFISCAEPVFESTCRRFEEKFHTTIHGCYAMAENVFSVTQGDDSAEFHGLRTSGKAFGSNEIKIENEEICIRSKHLFSSYDTGENNQIVNEWYHTGDSGVVQDGRLFVMGRVDDMFKSRGNKIIPEIIEQSATAISGVKPGRVACVAIPGKKEGELTSCVLYEGELEEFELLKNLRQLGIERCVQVPNGWLIKSSSGKISRKSSRQKFLDERLSSNTK